MRKRKLLILLQVLIFSFSAVFGGCSANQQAKTDYGQKTAQKNSVKEDDSMTNKTQREFEFFMNDKEEIPVSFVYGGTFYDGLKGFTKVDTVDVTEGEKRSLTTKFLHSDQKLLVTVDAAFYKDYDAYEWTVWFENVGTTDSRVLSDLWGADFELEGANPVVKGNLGDYAGHFAPFTRDLAKGDQVFDANTGRSAEQFLPYFNLETDDGGVAMAIGWPGTWRAEFQKDGNKTRILANGTTGLKTYLKPGEKVRTALMAFVRYYNRDEDEATNKWRRWVIDCNMPYETAQKTNKVPAVASVGFVSDTPFGWYRGGSEFENSTTWEDSYNAVYQRGLKFDYHWFDAGWYLDPRGSSLPDSWFSVGSWTVDRTKWPGNSLREYTDSMEKGLGVKGTIMWFEVERFHGAPIDINSAYGLDTDWLIPAQDSNFLVWHGNPDATDWLFNKITSAMTLAGADVYREDHNFPPVAAFRVGDALQGENRKGITENLHFQGKFKLWERIIDWQARTGRPTFIEMQSAGGNRQDLALLRYSVSFFRSDSDIVLNPPATVSKINALNKWIPFGGVLFGRVVDTDSTNPRDKYQWRSTYSSHISVPLQFRNLNEDTWKLLEWGLEEFEKYKEYVFYDFYELTPWKPLYVEDQWVSRMYYDKTLKKGVLETFNFPKTGETSTVVKLKGLDPNQYYSLTDPDGINGVSIIKGKDLMNGYRIYLQPRSSSLLWIDPVEI